VVKDLQETTDFYDKPWSSYDECLDRSGRGFMR
jgi:hypothetical protein